MMLSNDFIRDVSVFAIIALVTVAWASTTESTVAPLRAVRWALIGLAVASFAYLLIKRPSVTASALVGVLAISLYGFYSAMMLALSTTYMPGVIMSHIIWVTLVATTSGVFYLAPANKPVISDSSAWMYIFFCITLLLFTIVQGGLELNGFPRFVYRLGGLNDTEITYSQGISKIYGLAAVMLALLISREIKSAFSRSSSIALFVLFLSISLLGGGRGDFVIALLLSLVALRLRYIFILVGCIFCFFFIFQQQVSELLANYHILYERFLALSYSYGMRDSLLIDSFDLLLNEPRCMVFGCGISFFQSYYGYSLGLYPHNVPVEFLISFGGIITLSTIFLMFFGFRKIYRIEGYSSHFIFVFAFFLLVSLKSGSLITSYILVGCAAFLSQKGLMSFFRKNSKGKNHIVTN